MPPRRRDVTGINEFDLAKKERKVITKCLQKRFPNPSIVPIAVIFNLVLYEVDKLH